MPCHITAIALHVGLTAPTMRAIFLATVGFSTMIVFIVCFCDVPQRSVSSAAFRSLAQTVLLGVLGRLMGLALLGLRRGCYIHGQSPLSQKI